MASAELPQDKVDQTFPPVTVRPYLKAYEAAAILGCTPQAVTQLCRDGHLPAYRPMKTWLIDPDDLQAFIDAGSNQAVPA